MENRNIKLSKLIQPNLDCEDWDLQKMIDYKEMNKRLFRRLLHFAFLLFIAITVPSCGTELLSPSELSTYLSNPVNGVFKEKDISGLHVETMIKPTDMLVMQHIEMDSLINKAIVDSIRVNYKNYLYVILSMSQANHEILSGLAYDKNQFGEMVNQLAFGMKQNVFLTAEGKDTLQMVDYIYPRLFGMSHSTDMMFIFKKPDYKKEKWIKFHLNEFGLRTGDIRFKFQTRDIEKIPQIDFENINSSKI